MNREWAETRRTAWSSALQQVAREIGKDSPIYPMLGSTAWGRMNVGESQPNEKMGNVFLGLGYLQGVRSAALEAARTLKLEREEELLRKIHDRIPVSAGGHQMRSV